MHGHKFIIDVAGGNAVYYYHFDGLGSVAALSNVNSVIVERYSYDVFGRATVRDANNEQLTTSNFANPYMFTGRRYDDETGLYYYRARYYDPWTGRFMQTDPIGYLAGLNLYTYCGNNPINFVDPYGQSRIGDFFRGIWTGIRTYFKFGWMGDAAESGLGGYATIGAEATLLKKMCEDPEFYGSENYKKLVKFTQIPADRN